jgi:hypothetical protein
MATLLNIKVDPQVVQWNGTDLGFTDGDIELAFEEQGHEVQAHQEGTNILEMIRTGKNIEISLALKETSLAQITTLLTAGGGTATATAEVSTIVIGSVASINGKYFDIYSALNAIAYRVWFDVNNTGTAPATGGKTLVEVDLDATPTVAEAVTALTAALDALAAFVAVESLGTTVTVTNASTGGTTDIADGNTGFTFAVTTQGYSAVPGWGGSKDFTPVGTQSAKLVLHPVVKASTDLSNDLALWKAYPLLESIVSSGENPQMINVAFKIFPDLTRPSVIRLGVYGSHL